MMAVIVDHGDAVPLAGPGEAPLDAAEARDRLADRIVGKSQLVRDRDRRGGVERVVPSRHRQHETSDLMRHTGLAIAEHDIEAGTGAHRYQIDQARVDLRVFAKGDDRTTPDLATRVLDHGL